jgi:hypothetical protein
MGYLFYCDLINTTATHTACVYGAMSRPQKPWQSAFRFDYLAHVDTGDAKTGYVIDMLGALIVLSNTQLYLLETRSSQLGFQGFQRLFPDVPRRYRNP